MSLIFDTHAHYDDSAFNEDREEILSGLKSNGVGFVVDAAARCSSIPNIIKLTEQYDFLYGAAGLHPTELYKMECGEDDSIRGNKDFYAGDKEFEIVKEALKNPKIIAVGEICELESKSPVSLMYLQRLLISKVHVLLRIVSVRKRKLCTFIRRWLDIA